MHDRLRDGAIVGTVLITGVLILLLGHVVRRGENEPPVAPTRSPVSPADHLIMEGLRLPADGAIRQVTLGSATVRRKRQGFVTIAAFNELAVEKMVIVLDGRMLRASGTAPGPPRQEVPAKEGEDGAHATNPPESQAGRGTAPELPVVTPGLPARRPEAGPDPLRQSLVRSFQALAAAPLLAGTRRVSGATIHGFSVRVREEDGEEWEAIRCDRADLAVGRGRAGGLRLDGHVALATRAGERLECQSALVGFDEGVRITARRGTVFRNGEPRRFDSTSFPVSALVTGTGLLDRD